MSALSVIAIFRRIAPSCSFLSEYKMKAPEKNVPCKRCFLLWKLTFSVASSPLFLNIKWEPLKKLYPADAVFFFENRHFLTHRPPANPPLRFDHFARAAGNFFNIYRRLFSFKKSHKGHGKTKQCTSVSVILIGFLTHLARAAGKFFKCICLFLLGFRNVLARATGKFHSYQTR